MPTKKQRRRKDKNRRHEFEDAYFDDAGNEITKDEYEELTGEVVAAPAAKKDGTRANGKPVTTRAGRPVPPPSWRRSLKRAALFTPLLLIVVFAFDNKTPVSTKISIGIFYGLAMIPFLYLMDRVMYRRFQRLSQQRR
jgi:hypothetical protein